MTTFSRTWNAAYNASPADSDNISEGGGKIRNLKTDIAERLEVDHSWAGDADDGAHKKITFKQQASDPTTAANTGFLYTKDVSGKAELFWKDEDGDVIQLTSGGQLAGVPSGAITLWSGSIVSIPSGWALCDGTSGTPDLRDKFIVGAGSTYAVAATGGAATHDHGAATGSHVLTEAELPAHSHGLRGTTVVAGGDSGATQVLDFDSSGQTTTSTGSGTGHTHTIASASSLPPYYALAYIMKL